MIPPGLNELVTLIANVALALSLVTAVIFGIAQVRQAARDRRERFTLETLRGFSAREFAELMRFVTTRDLPQCGGDLKTLPAADHVLFVQLAQQMESLGILVAEGLVDIELVDKTLGDFVITAWNKYKPLFLDMREKMPDPYLGEYFQWLAELIAKRMAESPREPFYKMGATLP
jgi:hypothetical protein